MTAHIVSDKVDLARLVQLASHVSKLPYVERDHEYKAVKYIFFFILVGNVVEPKLAVELIVESNFCKA